MFFLMDLKTKLKDALHMYFLRNLSSRCFCSLLPITNFLMPNIIQHIYAHVKLFSAPDPLSYIPNIIIRNNARQQSVDLAPGHCRFVKTSFKT